MSIDNAIDDLIDETDMNCRIAASQVLRRYRAVCTFAQLQQEAGIWVLRHPGTCRSRLDDGKRGSGRLTNQIAKHLDGLARREKAYGLYEPEDEAFYTKAMVEAALPAVWDEHHVQRPPQVTDPAEQQVRGHGDPSEQGTWLAICIDVRRAWVEAPMGADARAALTYQFREHYEVVTIAELMGVTATTVQTYLAKGVRAMVNVLGGPQPGRCDRDCECQTGTRKVISNEQAATVTARDWE